MRRIVVLALLAMASLVVPSASIGADRAVGDTRLWARVPAPGMPEGIAVRDGVVYVGTHTSVRGNAGGPPSRIFRYDLETRALLGSIEIQGQNLAVTHGILAMAFDAAGDLYVVDRNPGRIVRIDVTTGVQETYATIPDLPACRPQGPTTNCAPVTIDEPTFADFFAFAPDGSAYVTDLQAATIFRVPPGGAGAGPTEIWYQDERFDGLFGLNGIAVDPSGEKLYFAMTGSQAPGSSTQGVIYTLPIVDQPSEDDLRMFHIFTQPAAGADGIAFGADGILYVALAGANQLAAVSPDGSSAQIWPDAASNALRDLPGDDEVPYDLPASIAFDGKGSILLTNQSFFAANEDHWAVLDVWVDDIALPLIEPSLP